MNKRLFVFCDGGARGNPGPAAVGVIIKNNQGRTLVKFARYLGKATNNVAEYQAVIGGLKWISSNVQPPISHIQFFLDSKLIVNQLNGIFKIKSPNLRNLIVKVRQLERRLGSKISYHFVPRKKNKEADFLVNQLLNKKIL